MTEISINGVCKPEFGSVRDEFEKNFKERGEVGASVCVIHEGEKVVDLWGGVADQETGRPWEEDSICVVWSTTKGLAAMCLHVLADRGEVDLNALVTDYWPEYGQNGKENTTVGHLMSHQAGVCVVTDTIPHGGPFDWELMVDMIEKQKPQFEPGTGVGYSALMYGWLLGEVVRRVSGKSFGAFFREEIAEPLGSDCWIGLPESEEARVAGMIPPGDIFPLDAPGFEIARELFTNSGGYLDFTPTEDGRPLFDTREAHAAEIGGGGGIANGRGLARAYAPWANGGSFDGVQLIGPDTLARARKTVSAVSLDLTLRRPVRFTMGFQRPWERFALHDMGATLGTSAFGYYGNGGSIGFADPEEKFSFGYAMNMMGVGLNERGQSLIDETYRSLGFRSDASGEWCR